MKKNVIPLVVLPEELKSKLKAKLDVILEDDDICRSLDIYIEEITRKIER